MITRLLNIEFAVIVFSTLCSLIISYKLNLDKPLKQLSFFLLFESVIEAFNNYFPRVLGQYIGLLINLHTTLIFTFYFFFFFKLSENNLLKNITKYLLLIYPVSCLIFLIVNSNETTIWISLIGDGLLLIIIFLYFFQLAQTEEELNLFYHTKFIISVALLLNLVFCIPILYITYCILSYNNAFINIYPLGKIANILNIVYILQYLIITYAYLCQLKPSRY